MQRAKETASNVAASAKAGMDKTMATVQEKVERVTAHDPMQKEMATERKQEKINQAEWNKQETREHNAASRQGASAGGMGTGTMGTGTGTGTYTHSATGATGQPMGGHQMSALPGHGTGHPTGHHVVDGVVGSHPIGTNPAGTGHTHTTAGGNNTHTNTGYGTGYGTGHGDSLI